MTQQHKDILTIIERHGPISTSEICEYLSTLGYGGAMAWQDFRGSVSKQLCYLRDKGDIAGEDKPQAKGKPMRVWAMAKAQEMASDVAEVQVNDDANWEAFKEAFKDTPIGLETVTPEPTVSVEVKAADKAPMSVQEVVDNYPLNFLDPNMFFAYCAGISKAERHHGISQ